MLINLGAKNKMMGNRFGGMILMAEDKEVVLKLLRRMKELRVDRRLS